MNMYKTTLLFNLTNFSISFFVRELIYTCMLSNHILNSDYIVIGVVVIPFGVAVYSILFTRSEQHTTNLKERIRARFTRTSREFLLVKSLLILISWTSIFVIFYIFDVKAVLNLICLCTYLVQIVNFIFSKIVLFSTI